MSTLSMEGTPAEVELVRGGARILTRAGESPLNTGIEGPLVSRTVLTPALLRRDHSLLVLWQVREEGPVGSGTDESPRASELKKTQNCYLVPP